MSEGEELSTRLALQRKVLEAVGYTWYDDDQCPGEEEHGPSHIGHWVHFRTGCTERPPEIGWGIVPIVVAAIEAKGWAYTIASHCPGERWPGPRMWMATISGWEVSVVESSPESLPTALCSAFVAAVEAQEGRV